MTVNMFFRCSAGIASSFVGASLARVFPEEIKGKFSTAQSAFLGSVASLALDMKITGRIEQKNLIHDVVQLKIGVPFAEVDKAHKIRNIKSRFSLNRGSIGLAFGIGFATQLGGAYRKMHSFF